MTERIESYLKQHHCRDYFNSYGERVEDDHYFMYREEVDGLIELIVKECEQISLKNSHRNDDMGAIIARQIRKHFGVEE